MDDQWTTAVDCMGDGWNDLLNDLTRYARDFENCGNVRAAQEYRDHRWDVLGQVQRGEL